MHVIVETTDNVEELAEEDTIEVWDGRDTIEVWDGRADMIIVHDPFRVSELKSGGVKIITDAHKTLYLDDANITEVMG